MIQAANSSTAPGASGLNVPLSVLTCRAVIEAANSPTTPEGDAVLRQRGIPVLPDLYANGGGVVVSFFEWVQNTQNFKWEEDDIVRSLDRWGDCGVFAHLSDGLLGLLLMYRFQCVQCLQCL